MAGDENPRDNACIAASPKFICGPWESHITFLTALSSQKISKRFLNSTKVISQCADICKNPRLRTSRLYSRQEPRKRLKKIVERREAPEIIQ